MDIGMIACDRPERCHQQWEGQHHRHQPSRHEQFNNHHPVQGADHQGRRDAHGELEQGQAQQPGHRQARAGHIGKRQPPYWHLFCKFGKHWGSHERTHSIALDL